MVPSGHFSHWPAPSQNPSWPQVDASEASHSESGSLWAVMKLHVPLVTPVLAEEQATHFPVHAELQQTPSTQAPVVHSVPSEQGAPVAFFPAHLPIVLSQ